MTPNISVIVPVYNAEKYLYRCIDSILAQTYTDFELLLINDGSKDKSGKICEEYAAKDVRVRVFHKENGGVSSARNLGLDNAKGKWIAFVDSDDYIEPCMYETMLRQLTNGDADVCLCDIKISSEHRNEIVSYSISGNKDTDLENYIYSEWHSSCNILASKSLFDRANLRYVEGIAFCEDFHLTMRLLLSAEKVVNVSQALYIYHRDNDSSATHSFDLKKQRDRRWCDIDIINILRSQGLLERYEKAMSERVLSYTQVWAQDKSKWNDFLEFYPESHSYIITCGSIVFWRKLLMLCLCNRLWMLANMILFCRNFIKRIK